MVIIKAFPSGPYLTNAYIVACSVTSKAAIIDPAPESTASILSYLTQHHLKADKILLTHSHWDHIADVSILKEKLSLPVYVHSLDRGNLEQPGSDGLPLPIDIQGVTPDYTLEDGENISIGQLTLQVIHTPGHSPGCVCFYDLSSNTLISGDTLFKGSIGKISFPNSQPELMRPSLEKLRRLPAETTVYPGHGPSTTIGKELANARKMDNFN